MRKVLTMSCAAAALLLAGCATGYGHYHSGLYVNGYYDGFYGPYPGGYWGPSGYFFYLGHDNHYHRDDGHHFRRREFDGSRHFRAEERSHDRGRSRDSRSHDQSRGRDRGRR